MTLEEYQELAKKELSLKEDIDHLKNALANRAYIHARWMRYYRDEKSAELKMLRKFAEMRRDRWHHLRGDSPPEAYKDDPVDFYLSPQKTGTKKTGKPLVVTISMLEMHLEADPKYCDARDRLEEQKATVKFLEDILKTMIYRSREIDTMIELLKFENGR